MHCIKQDIKIINLPKPQANFGRSFPVVFLKKEGINL
jgi:hypothetical protein